MNLRTVLILVGALLFVAMPAARAMADPAVQPVPTPQPADPCGDTTTSILATANRPTVGYSACAVKAYEALGEFGYANERASDGSATISYPQGFVRYGAAPNLEFDFIGPARQTLQQNGATMSGALDSGVGAKRELYHDRSTVLAVDVLLTFPTGSRAFTLGAPSQTFNLDASHNLTPTLSIGGTLGVSSSVAPDLLGRVRRFGTLLPSAVLVQQFSPFAQAYVEGYGATRLRPDGGARIANDEGFQFLLAHALEFDMETGRTVTDAGRSHYVGFGLAIRAGR